MVQRSLPNLIIVDARTTADNVILIIQRLKSAAQAGACRVLAITDLVAVANNADCGINEAKLAQELRSAVLRLVGVDELLAPPSS